MRHFALRPLFAAMLVLSPLAPPASVLADEGMWTFNNVPVDDIKKRYDFTVTDAWLENVRLASVRFNSGGSGSFVSPDGLVMTNHHIASDVLGKISTPERNYFKTGFLAATRADEVKAPDLELNVLASIEDVTARVNGAVKAGATAAQANEARKAEISRVEKESLAATGLRSDVVTLYRGGQYQLYRYKRYTDVRLVFAPEYDVAFFGGDPDNFTYPRYDLDLAIFRVYENDKPVRAKNYFKWSKDGAKEGDLVFVSGSPGATSRLNTVAHLEFLRDVQNPFSKRYYENRRDALARYAAIGEEQERQSHDDYFSTTNSLKVTNGELGGLNDAALMNRKRDAEQKLRASVAADARKSKEYGDAWDAVARARASLKAYYPELSLIENGRGLDSSLFEVARTIVRLVEESEKPDAERLRGYTDSARNSLELALYSPAPVYPAYEKARLAASLAFMQSELGADHAVVAKVLGGKTPEARAAELVDGSKLADVAARKALVAGGKKAVAESTDPMIVLARAIDPESRALYKRSEDEVTGVQDVAYAKIARALYEAEGPGRYPDATRTPRIAYGAVKGYEENGKRIAPFTDFAGMFARSDAAGNKDPYRLPERWLAKRSALSGKTPLNFVTTSDTIGGNSGSPVINAKAEVVGLNFDRNIHGLVRNFVYDETRARNVAVDSRGMLEALRVVYGADALVRELTGSAK